MKRCVLSQKDIYTSLTKDRITAWPQVLASAGPRAPFFPLVMQYVMAAV